MSYQCGFYQAKHPCADEGRSNVGTRVIIALTLAAMGDPEYGTPEYDEKPEKTRKRKQKQRKLAKMRKREALRMKVGPTSDGNPGGRVGGYRQG